MKIYTIYENNNKLVIATTINGCIHFFQKGFVSNEEAKDFLIEEGAKKELEKHPNLSPSLSREFAENDLDGIWGEWK